MPFEWCAIQPLTPCLSAVGGETTVTARIWSAFESCSDWHSPAHSEGLGGDLESRDSLSSLVFISINGSDYPPHCFRVEVQPDDICQRVVFVKVVVQNLV